MASKTFRVAIIGDTPRGRYGHWLDQAFAGVEGAEIVALSNSDEADRQAATPRNGDELFLDFHPHMFDVMWLLFGAPLWCHARITQDGRRVTPEDVDQGEENYGLVAGNGLNAYYAFEDGGGANFKFYEGNGDQIISRTDIQSTKGTISLPGAIRSGPDIHFDPSSHPRPVGDDKWEIIDAELIPDQENKWINSET